MRRSCRRPVSRYGVNLGLETVRRGISPTGPQESPGVVQASAEPRGPNWLLSPRSKLGVFAERSLHGGENLSGFRQPEFSHGLPELNFQRGGSAAFACDFGLGLPLGLLCRESDELAAARLWREAPGRLSCFSGLLCRHVGGVLS